MKMREILFRGKTKDGRWVYGDLVRRLVETTWQDILGEYQFAIAGQGEREKTVDFKNKRAEVISCTTVDPATVGQFTGLVDRMHTKIFSGDEVAWSWGETFNGAWERSGVIVVDIFNPEDMRCLYEAHELLIIGNIHDTPDLGLKEEAE